MVAGGRPAVIASAKLRLAEQCDFSVRASDHPLPPSLANSVTMSPRRRSRHCFPCWRLPCHTVRPHWQATASQRLRGMASEALQACR